MHPLIAAEFARAHEERLRAADAHRRAVVASASAEACVDRRRRWRWRVTGAEC